MSRTTVLLPSKHYSTLLQRAMAVPLCFLFGLFFCLAVSAQESILEFSSDIKIQQDGSLVVTETVRVRAEGNQIRRGIYRDFPTQYRDRNNNRYRVDFDLIDVLRDGQSEPHHIESLSNGLRIYAGSASRTLTPGIYEYTLKYRTQRQLGFFDDYDELYWNVTGNGWGFTIEKASALVTLPAAVNDDDLRLASYTGRQGATGSMASVSARDSRRIEFSTQQALDPREGLTIAVGWPKGLIQEPSTEQRINWFFRDNGGALVLLLSWLLSLVWYIHSWNRHGRDPKKGVIIPRYEPPSGLSAAACRYVLDMAFRQEAFTAAIISLGVKGYVQIEEDDDEFTLQALKGPYEQAPSSGEQVVLDELLPGQTGRIELKQSEHSRFGKARAGLSGALASEYKGRLFKLNGWYALPPVVLSGLALIAAIALGQANPLIWAGWVISMLFMHILFIYLLRAPSLAGRQVMDEIEGFKLYLGTAEQQRLEQMRSPTLTPEVFESFLPYAFALGVENQWCERFERELPQQGEAGSAYNPAWYTGQWGRASALNHLGSDLGSSLSKAIVASSSPPGSSSGSGGGGFSGGGGGGGGGGGW